MRQLSFPSKLSLLFIGLSIFLSQACMSTSVSQSDAEDNSQKIAGFYNQTIHLPPNANPAQEAAAQDLKKWLEAGTGKSFRIDGKQSGGGIFLSVKNPAKSASQEYKKLSNSSGHSFYLYSPNAQTLIIDGQSDKGLHYGVYRYLQELGYRWYFPGELWTKVPTLSDIQGNFNKAYIPAFRFRGYFGTGGLPNHPVLDPTGKVLKEWKAWELANALQDEFYLRGHTGEAFNQKHKATLQAHPEYLALVKDKRPWKVNAKYCYSNAGLRKLMVQDRLEAYELQLKQHPGDPYYKFAIGIDPSDGGGHCTCGKCEAMGSVSDRVFGMANEVAKALRKKHPEAHVNLYSYNVHAAVPSIPLENNVHVTVITSAFQNEASPEQLLDEWAHKTGDFAIYDYWGLYEWGKDYPVNDYLKLSHHIKTWKESYPNLEGHKLESSYSIGATAIGLYLASQLYWDPTLNPDQLLDEMYTDMFAEAKAPMIKLQERWRNQFQGYNELPFALIDLKEASSLAKNPKVISRINAYKQYVHFMRLSLQYQALAKDAPKNERVSKANSLIEYAWRIYATKMVHSFLVSNRTMYAYEKKNPEVGKKWSFNRQKASTDAYAKLQPMTKKEIEQTFQKDLKELPVRFQPVKTKRQDLAIKEPAFGERNLNSASAPNEIAFQLDQHFVFDAYSINEKLVLPVKARETQYSWSPHHFISVTDEDGKVIHYEVTPLDDTYRDVVLTFPKPGKYMLEFRTKRCLTYMKLPTNRSLAFVDKVHLEVFPKKAYFYVPPGQTEIAFDPLQSVYQEIYDSKGNKMPMEKRSERLIIVKVPASEQAKMWSYRLGKNLRNIELLNVPPLYGLSEQFEVGGKK